MNDNIKESLEEHKKVFNLLELVLPDIEAAARRMIDAIRNGGKVIWMGNGGSAADAQHLAAELVGRFRRERNALPSIAITTDTSILTAVGNDYGFDNIFSRQMDGLCNPKDAVVGISTSGNSPNVLKALDVAEKKGAFTIGFSGGIDGGLLKKQVDLCIHVPHDVTARIQEAHIFIGHVICDLVEEACLEL